MPEYRVIVSRRVAENLLVYTAFIAQVSLDAVRRFVEEYEEVLLRLEENPFQFQVDTSFDNPKQYRKVLFGKWFKCVFLVEPGIVYLDAIVDVRQNKTDELEKL